MSVEALGSDLLGEVKVEGLNEVWSDPEPLFLHRSHRLTFSSYCIHYKISTTVQVLPLALQDSIDFLIYSRILPLLGNSNTTTLNGMPSKKGQLRRRRTNHYRS